MGKIRFHIPNGMRKSMENTDDIDAWIKEKFGSKIIELITDNPEEFRFEEFTKDDFKIAFTYEDDANQFLKLFGGKKEDD